MSQKVKKVGPEVGFPVGREEKLLPDLLFDIF